MPTALKPLYIDLYGPRAIKIGTPVADRGFLFSFMVTQKQRLLTPRNDAQSPSPACRDAYTALLSTYIKPTLDSFVQVLPQPKSLLPSTSSRDALGLRRGTLGFRDAPPPPPPPPTQVPPLAFRAATDSTDKVGNSTGSASPAAPTAEVAELTRKVAFLSRQVSKQDRQIGRLIKVLKYNGINTSEDEEDEVDGGGHAGKGNKRKTAGG
ncbi:hypothetical protein B0T26DRAFT_675854 [Lasiosphaeria miniovina]|uniref:Uncharacterized protein n=1 Tax=Lasiosphaeria miniovina TaxID=1954250 RepID=A0AA40AKL4_9PEZI|nr:uncharacterized protein B0T26DRAFT_675854 [Lasiosphaeria miniovina]KAK0717572.1 hypothetical protein B0T26DRAFT_675854 [Lasiosphaeria miniovina]